MVLRYSHVYGQHIMPPTRLKKILRDPIDTQLDTLLEYMTSRGQDDSIFDPCLDRPMCLRPNSAAGHRALSPNVDEWDIPHKIVRNGELMKPSHPHYEPIMQRLRGRRVEAQHDGHLYWEPGSPMAAAQKSRIIQQHRVREPLIEFRGDGSIWQALAE